MKQNALALLLEPEEDQTNVVRMFMGLPKNTTHVMLFGHNTRSNAFVEWYFSQCGYRVRLMIPTRNMQNRGWDRKLILKWIHDTKWFPSESRVLMVRFRSMVRVLTPEMDVEVTDMPLYSEGIHNITLQQKEDEQSAPTPLPPSVPSPNGSFTNEENEKYFLEALALLRKNRTEFIQKMKNELFEHETKLKRAYFERLLFDCSIHAFYESEYGFGKKCTDWILGQLREPFEYYKHASTNLPFYENAMKDQ